MNNLLTLINAQNWLDSNYPFYERQELKKLLVSEKLRKTYLKNGKFKGEILEGELELKNFVKLETFLCGINSITRLYLGDCNKLRILSCHSNKLTELSLKDNGMLDESDKRIIELYCNNNRLTYFGFINNLDPKALRILDLSDNDFPEQDLSIFGKFVNLEYFYLANNRFYGSLEHFMQMEELKILDISFNKRIDSGLEDLIKKNKLLKIKCEDDHPLVKSLEEFQKRYNVLAGYGGSISMSEHLNKKTKIPSG